MSRKFFILAVTAFAFDVFFTNGFYSLNGWAQTAQPTPNAAAIEKAKNEYLANICSGHGGINCSAINSGFSITCNDGTVDESPLSIFSVPQCQKTVEDLINRQSDLMAQTGCYPPSEITCINQSSYDNAFQRLKSLGLADSELGKIELEECRKEISAYQNKNNDYKQCLKDNNIPPINLPGDRFALPMLKAVFCPLFYGKNSSYDSDLDLCICDENYFKYGGACLEKSSVCESKYGVGSYAKNNNCSLPAPVPFKTPLVSSLVKQNSAPTPATITENNLYPSPVSMAQISSRPIPITPAVIKNEYSANPTIEPETRGEEAGSPAKTLKGIVNSVLSGIKNIFKIFK